MIGEDRVLAVIPARGQSKRTPRKNLREFRGKPLIQWTIEAAREAEFIDRVVFSTEDAEIKDLALSLGAEVIDRPLWLATDLAANEDVIRHALAIHPNHNWLVLLQPTSPLRTPEDINKSIRLAHMTHSTCVSCREDGTRNGAVYVMHSALLERGYSFMNVPRVIWYRMPNERSLDIDLPEHFNHG